MTTKTQMRAMLTLKAIACAAFLALVGCGAELDDSAPTETSQADLAAAPAPSSTCSTRNCVAKCVTCDFQTCVARGTPEETCDELSELCVEACR